ncbi:MAG TPA: sigma-70 family RNA polymerase sigma factor [Acidimicrobiales bacterium]|jgi:RNA polymerase sigma-70 factor (ECF subfamily)
MADRSPSDASLATLALSGDVEALAGLFERYRPSLYAAAIRILRNRDEAQDAVQDTCLTALVRLDGLRDPEAAGGWLHAVLRNTCLLRLRHHRPDVPLDAVEVAASTPAPDEILDRHALRDWLWAGFDRLSAEDRVTLTLRYFSRCQSYQAIASVTGVPVGTVRSRLNRARSQLDGSLRGTLATSPLSHASLQRSRRAQWEQFYAELHRTPQPRTYRDAYTPDVQVTDHVGTWAGIEDWAAHEREAIQLGVRATIVDLVAGPDHTILEIDFTNPDWAQDHCPPRSTFVHQITAGRSRRLDIHYV